MTQEKGAREIEVNYVRPPIPIRTFDWSAKFDDYEKGDIMGWGVTRALAIKDLLRQEAELD